MCQCHRSEFCRSTAGGLHIPLPTGFSRWAQWRQTLTFQPRPSITSMKNLLKSSRHGTSRNQGTLGCREEVPGTRLIIFHIGLSCFRASIGINRPNPQCHTHGEYCNGKLEETKLRKGHRTVGVNVIYFPIFRQAWPNFFTELGRAWRNS